MHSEYTLIMIALATFGIQFVCACILFVCFWCCCAPYYSTYLIEVR
jgi:hypothetical protein